LGGNKELTEVNAKYDNDNELKEIVKELK